MLVVRAQDLATPCHGDDDCCDGILCGMNEGDCDSHEDCAGHLRCGVDNCIGSGFDSTDDCCWEDPLFPPTGSGNDGEMCKILRGFKRKITQAAVAQGCDSLKERLQSISMEECTQISCSAELIGKSFTCNNQNKEEGCKEMLTLLDVMDKIDTTQCSTLLRTSTQCSADGWAAACTDSDACGYCDSTTKNGQTVYGCVSQGNSQCTLTHQQWGYVSNFSANWFDDCNTLLTTSGLVGSRVVSANGTSGNNGADFVSACTDQSDSTLCKTCEQAIGSHCSHLYTSATDNTASDCCSPRETAHTGAGQGGTLNCTS